MATLLEFIGGLDRAIYFDRVTLTFDQLPITLLSPPPEKKIVQGNCRGKQTPAQAMDEK